jgi:hypothetical protein
VNTPGKPAVKTASTARAIARALFLRYRFPIIYDAPTPDVIRDDAARNALPAGKITEVSVLAPYFYY